MQKINLSALFMTVLVSLSSKASEHRLYNASFLNNVDRYVSVLGFFAELERLVPVREEGSLPKECQEVTETNVAVLGANEPSVSQALEAKPGVLYFNLYQRCVHVIIENSFSKIEFSNDNAKQILGGLARKVGTGPWDKIKLSDLGEDVQKAVLNRFVTYIVGPEPILISKKYIGESNIFENPELTNLEKLSIFLRDHILQINPNSSLSEMYASLIIILRNGPVIKV